jgi:hypothetical protein
MKLVHKRRCDTKNLAAAPNLVLHRIIYYHILAPSSWASELHSKLFEKHPLSKSLKSRSGVNVQWFEKVKLHFDKSMSVVISDPVLRLRDGVIATMVQRRKAWRKIEPVEPAKPVFGKNLLAVSNPAPFWCAGERR